MLGGIELDSFDFFGWLTKLWLTLLGYSSI